ncbi:mandelate racemase/muconate lactonizing enzyme family protein [Falsiroseomonas sp. HW251]|uniref:mandelate racemase/muconate lactonizing enzyme family protein n=1 Tax=Falsiroseomonas sp. HW251 TaxID=3390998 RepID=UPI003D320483
MMRRIAAVEAVVYRQAVHHRGATPTLAGVPRRHFDALLVRVEAEGGLVGWGECFGLYESWPVVREMLRRIVGPSVIGLDATDPAGSSDAIIRRFHGLGGSGAFMHAVSGLEVALWDIKGKEAGLPLHSLLGGAGCDTVPAYASLPRYGAPDAVTRDTEEALARGFRGIKLHEITAPNIRVAARCMPAEGELMVDVNCAWSADGARAILAELADVELAWVEEPLHPPDDYEALAALRRDSGRVIACGENAASILDFDRMAQAVDVVQPSVAKLGGLSAMLRVAEIAKRRGARFAPHSPYFGPALLATIHLLAAIAPTTPVEAYFFDLGAGPFGDAVMPQGARFAVPQGPGLGCDPDPEVLARCAVP